MKRIGIVFIGILLIASSGCSMHSPQAARGATSDSGPPLDGGSPLDGGAPRDAAHMADPHNVFFATSTLHAPGELGGLANADAICAERALAAGLSGTFVAYLGTNQALPETRLAGSRGWVRTDGKPFLDTVTAFIDANPWHDPDFYPPSLDEFGVPVVGPDGQTPPDGDWVMVGHPYGTNAPASTCGDWTSNDAGYAGVGFSSAGHGAWAMATVHPCDQKARLYCAEIGKNLAVAPERVPSRIAFATGSGQFLSAGPEWTDVMCAHFAAQSGLTGTYKALLAHIGESAASRFVDGLPWARLDGVVVATYAQLASGAPLNAPITLAANGSYSGIYRMTILTGAPDSRTPGTRESTCNGWTPPYDSMLVTYGVEQQSGRGYFNYGQVPCSSDFTTYCLQE